MKRIFLFFALFFALFSAIPAQNLKQNEWLGTYIYSIGLNRNPNSGYMDTVEYELKIFRRADQMLVRYKADGLRTWDNYECRVEIKGNQLDIYYQKDLREGELGSNDRGLKKGALLGSLIKSVVRGKIRFTLRNATLIDLARNPIFKKKD